MKGEYNVNKIIKYQLLQGRIAVLQTQVVSPIIAQSNSSEDILRELLMNGQINSLNLTVDFSYPNPLIFSGDTPIFQLISMN